MLGDTEKTLEECLGDGVTIKGIKEMRKVKHVQKAEVKNKRKETQIKVRKNATASCRNNKRDLCRNMSNENMNSLHYFISEPWKKN